MDGSILAVMVSAYLSGTPVNPENPPIPDSQYHREFPDIINRRRREETISTGGYLPYIKRNTRGSHYGKFNRHLIPPPPRRDYRPRRF